MTTFSLLEVLVMMTLVCNDVDSSIDCPFVACGETEDAIFTDTARHAKEVHGYIDEQLNEPQIIEKMRSVIKQE